MEGHLAAAVEAGNGYARQVLARIPAETADHTADLDLPAHAAQASGEGIRSAVAGTLGSHGAEPAAIDLLSQLLDYWTRPGGSHGTRAELRRQARTRGWAAAA
ncbi:hypothetical protein ACGFYY_21965 [Streptomyces sp. NPDC048331]|uniref:hypothetical protein n=1 Tax=Streptomyces sp. NPDC048331 TaxID=3365534 RepID=UPI003720DF34